ncbi:unnamed protein product [Closterium sp. NIES-54]
MKVIGLTGGIASGKSTVCQELKSRFGFPVIDADKTAHDVMRKDTPAYSQVVKEFGPSVLTSEGEIDRNKLGEIVFVDSNKRRKLNSIMHPHIAYAIARQLFSHWWANHPLVILDAPLLYETGLNRATRAVIVVFCETEQQVERLMKRNSLQEDDARRRVAAQMPMELKVKRADYVIDNTGEWSDTSENVSRVVKSIRTNHNSVNALLDAVLVPAGLLLLASYHAWLVTQIKRRPLATVLGVAHTNRRTWVQCVMKESNATNGMLAVQSLRNSIMACVLLASTSATGAVAIATILTSIRLDNLQETLSSMTIGSASSDLLLLKVFCIFLCFLFAFLCHTQAIRFLSHVNFLITIPIDSETSPGLSISYSGSLKEAYARTSSLRSSLVSCSHRICSSTAIAHSTATVGVEMTDLHFSPAAVTPGSFTGAARAAAARQVKTRRGDNYALAFFAAAAVSSATPRPSRMDAAWPCTKSKRAQSLNELSLWPMAASHLIQAFTKRQRNQEAGAITSVVHKEVDICIKSEMLLQSSRDFFNVITTDREGAKYHEQSYPSRFPLIPNLAPPSATDIKQAAGPHGLHHLSSSEKHHVPLTADWGRVLPLAGTAVDDGRRLQPVRGGTELGLGLSLPEPEPDSSRPVPSSECNHHQQQRKRQRLVFEQPPVEPPPLGGGNGVLPAVTADRFQPDATALLPAAVSPAVAAQKDIASLMLGCLHSDSLNSTLLQRLRPQGPEPPGIGTRRLEVRLGFPNLRDSVSREVEIGVRRTPAPDAAVIGKEFCEASTRICSSFANFREPSSAREAWLVERLREAQEWAESESRRVANLERQVTLMLREMGEAQRLVAGLSRKNAELQGEMAQLMLAHMVVGLAEAGAGGLELGNRVEGGGEAGGMEEGRGDSEEVIQPSSRQT